MKVVSKKIRNAAKGQDCTLAIPGICSFNPETVVLCHFPDEFGGMGTKPSDLSAGFGCHDCHAAIDGRLGKPMSREEREFYMRRSANRTISKLLDLGIIRVVSG